MTVEILGTTIERVLVIDDQPDSRESLGFTVEDANLTAVSLDGPFQKIEPKLIDDLLSRAQAAVCDYKLSLRNYAQFTGGDLVRALYEYKFPTILCTRWETAELLNITPLRRWIPWMIKPGELNEESLIEGLEACLAEFSGTFARTRQPWRTQVHFLFRDEAHEHSVYLEVPAWSAQDVIKVNVNLLPANLSAKPLDDFRCHAQVNLAAESIEELFLSEWEIA